MNDLFLLGGGGHARDIFGLIAHISESGTRQIRVEAILDDHWENKDRFIGCEVELLKGIASNLRSGNTFISCIGYPGGRKKLTELALRAGMRPHEALVHPGCNLGGNCSIGPGSAVLGATSFSPNATVGEHSYVSVGVIVGHDTVIGNNVSIMPGASISGDVVVGSDVLIGSGAIILERVVIGDGAVVGAGSLVTRNVGKDKTVMGIPAKSR